jgi:hypothetical protein
VTPSTKPRPTLGPINDGEVYPLEVFKARSGLSDWAMRQARRAGLRVITQGSRRFVRGIDWSEYLAGRSA